MLTDAGAIWGEDLRQVVLFARVRNWLGQHTLHVFIAACQDLRQSFFINLSFEWEPDHVIEDSHEWTDIPGFSGIRQEQLHELRDDNVEAWEEQLAYLNWLGLLLQSQHLAFIISFVTVREVVSWGGACWLDHERYGYLESLEGLSNEVYEVLGLTAGLVCRGYCWSSGFLKSWLII